MAFTLPTFNLVCNIWRFGNATTNPPDLIANVNLCRGERSSVARPIDTALVTKWGEMWLLLPKNTDIRDGKAIAGPDTVEVPAGSGRYYEVQWVDDAGSGFPNEHRFAAILATVPWPTPFPSGGAVGPYNPLLEIVFNADDSGVISVVINTGMGAATWTLIMVTAENGSVPAPILNSANVGLVPVTYTGVSVSIGSWGTRTTIWTWNDPVGTDTLTIADGGLTFSYIYGLYANSPIVLDVAGSGGGVTGVVSLTTSAPVVASGETAILVVQMVDSAGTSSIDLPAFANIPTDVAITISGQSFRLLIGAAKTSGAVPMTISGTTNPGGGFVWNGDIVVFK